MEGNKENLQLSLSLKDSSAVDVQQNVSTDANANIIIYHVVMDGIDVTINDDFDKNIQLLKISTDLGTGCFVTPLNRSHSFDPNMLSVPSKYQVATQNKQVNASSMDTTEMSYDVAPTPINDTTFLGKRANALCANIPIYWLQPSCTGPATTTAAVSDHVRTKRGFSCSFHWYYCTKTIKILFIKKTITYICGGGVLCCSGSFCVSADTDCEACLLVSTWLTCVSLC